MSSIYGSGENFKSDSQKKPLTFKILSIKKRNRIIRFFSVNYWKVKVELDSEEQLVLNCWAGCQNPSASTLLHDVKRQIKSKFEQENFPVLQGKTFNLMEVSS